MEKHFHTAHDKLFPSPKSEQSILEMYDIALDFLTNVF